MEAFRIDSWGLFAWLHDGNWHGQSYTVIRTWKK
jgi:hypothetical protein